MKYPYAVYGNRFDEIPELIANADLQKLSPLFFLQSLEDEEITPYYHIIIISAVNN
jgi:hypothetical protein